MKKIAAIIVIALIIIVSSLSVIPAENKGGEGDFSGTAAIDVVVKNENQDELQSLTLQVPGTISMLDQLMYNIGTGTISQNSLTAQVSPNGTWSPSDSLTVYASASVYWSSENIENINLVTMTQSLTTSDDLTAVNSLNSGNTKTYRETDLPSEISESDPYTIDGSHRPFIRVVENGEFYDLTAEHVDGAHGNTTVRVRALDYNGNQINDEIDLDYEISLNIQEDGTLTLQGKITGAETS